MGLFDNFPYTNFHELNLDWILRALRELEHEIEQFVSINALKYANPIQWDITTQYEKNTIVIDPQTGTAYISVQPVPSGVALTNTDYWTVVFNLSEFIVRAAQNLTLRYEPETTTTATFNTPINAWVVWGDVLYRALTNINAGDAYVIGSNIERITVIQVIDEVVTGLNNKIGLLSQLLTTDKSSVVNAINEVFNKIITDCAAVQSNLDQAILTESTTRANADTALSNRITTLENGLVHKYIFISDSYGARTYNNKTLIELMADFAGIDSSNYHNIQQNGSGFIGLEGIDDFLTLLQNATISIPANQITDIIVMGGANDIVESRANVEAAIDAFCTYCHTTYPRAKIRLAHVGRFWDKARHDVVPTTSLPAWRSCGAYGANYISNSEYILHKRSLVESDNVHPTTSGVYELAKQMSNALQNDAGICDVHYITDANITVKNGAVFTTVTKPGTSPINISVDNGITTINFGAEQRIVALCSTQSFTTDIAINDIADIAQTDDCMLFGNLINGVSQGIDISASPIDTSNVMLGTMPGILYVGSSGNILFNLQNRFIPNSSSTSYAGLQIYVAGRSYCVPSELC